MIRDADGKFVAYRGFYGNKPGEGSHPFLPPESYFTYGGFDWMTAKLGGVWDSLLGDGLRWWITANSDSHNYFNDLQDVDRANYNTVGYVTEADRYLLRPSYGDFRPGEYSRTYTITREPTYAAVMEALRAGRAFVVQGDLIDRLKLTAETRGQRSEHSVIGMGGTLHVKKGRSVRVEMKIQVPGTPNWNNQRPTVDHVDLIAGDINHPSARSGPDALANPSTKVVRTFSRGDRREREQGEGLVLAMEHTFERVEQDFYIRLRGTNTHDRNPTPTMDPDLRGQTGPGESPWDDLWFYSNPIFVQVEH